jgi:hypothetical protein
MRFRTFIAVNAVLLVASMPLAACISQLDLAALAQQCCQPATAHCDSPEMPPQLTCCVAPQPDTPLAKTDVQRTVQLERLAVLASSIEAVQVSSPMETQVSSYPPAASPPSTPDILRI